MLTRKSFKVVSFLAAFSLLSAGAFAEDIFVSANWSDQVAVDADPNGAGLTFGTDAFNSVQNAINAAVNGDTITIFPGYYGENIVVNKENLTLIGPNDGINPGTQTRGPEAILKRVTLSNPAGRVSPSIRGLTFDAEGENITPIVVNNSADADIAYNVAKNVSGSSTRFGIQTYSAPRASVRYNLIENLVGGTHTGIRGSSGNNDSEFIGNTIRNVAYSGFIIAGQNNVLIIGNSITNVGRHGINVGGGCTNITIAGNYIANVNFRNNRDDRHTGAIRLYSGNPTSPESSAAEGNVANVLIEYNTVDNANYAVFFRNAYSGTGQHTDTMLPPGVIIRNNNFLNSVYAAIGMPGINLDDNEAIIENNFLQGNPTLVDDFNIIPTTTGDQVVPTDTDLIDVVSSAGSFLPLDSDGDGIPDWKEIYVYGTDPNDPDEDGDGVPDGLQIALGGDPTTGTPGTINGEPLTPANLPGDCDSDGDGYSDAYKVLLGLDPNDPTVSPSLGDVNNNGFIDNGDAAIVFNVAAGLISSANFNLNRMDVNQDGVVNNIDANILFNRFLGVPGFEILPYKPGVVCD